MLRRGNILAPEITLGPENMLCLRRCEDGWDGIKGIHLVHREVAANGERFCRIVGLVVIEIDRRRGSHDHIMMRLCRHDPPLNPPPRHHSGSRWQAACENLIPSQESAMMVREERPNL